MNIVVKMILFAAFCAWGCGRASADFLLTFEGLQNHEQVANYYDGGTGSLGSGPGPNFGVTFSANALALIRDSPFPGDPSPPDDLLLGNFGIGAGQPISMTMDVSGGFSGALSFYDITIGRTGSVTIWSGMDGTGAMLAQLDLPLTPEAFSNPTILSFAGVAQSVVFNGGNLQLVIEDIATVSAVPEPAAWISLITGLGCLAATRRRGRAKTASR